METLDMIGKVLCIFLLVVVIIMCAVLLVCLIRDLNDKE